MTSEREEFLDILAKNLSLESQWFLGALMQQKDSLAKEELRDVANQGYRAQKIREGVTEPKTLITSRHALDIHTARIEGAGLVEVKEKGRVRLYYLTELGEELLKFVARQKFNQEKVSE